jgi:hypothetical protein
MKKASYLLLAFTLAIVLSVFLSAARSASSNPCSSCHGGSYYQVLDILEGDSENQLPAAINAGETKTVAVVVENSVNTVKYSTLSSVSLTLQSKNGHFSVKDPTYCVGTLEAGTQTAAWEITGTSDEEDSLFISATARNSHVYVFFSDIYLPAPAIVVGTPNPLAPTIQLNSPVDGESWFFNSTHNINLNTSGGVGQLKVTLEYGTTGTDPWLNIATDLPGSGSFAWRVPNTDTQYAYVRATVIDSASPVNSAYMTSRVQVLLPSTSSRSIPEFPTAPILTAFMLVLVLFVVLFKKTSA